MIKLLLLISMCVVVVADIGLDAEDDSEWLDPHDMIRYDPATKTMFKKKKRSSESQDEIDLNSPNDLDQQLNKVESTSPLACTAVDPRLDFYSSTNYSPAKKCDCSKIKQNSSDNFNCAQCEAYFYKRFIRHLLLHFKYEGSNEADEDVYNVQIKLSKSDITILEKYVSSKDEGSIQDADDVLTHIIHKVWLQNPNFSFQETYGSTWTTWMKNNVMWIAPLLGFVLIWRLVSHVTPFGIFVLGMMIVLVISVAFEYINMFQKLEARRYVESLKFGTVPAECDPSSAHALQVFWWSVKVEFFGMEDPCKRYYENLLTDAQFEINPLMAVASTFGKVLEVFSKYLGSSFAIFYKNLLGQFSILTNLLILVASTITFVLCLKYLGRPAMNTFLALCQSSRQNIGRNRIEDVPRGNGNSDSSSRPSGIEPKATTTTVNQYFLQSSAAVPSSFREQIAFARTISAEALVQAADIERIENLDTPNECMADPTAAISDTEQVVTEPAAIEKPSKTHHGDLALDRNPESEINKQRTPPRSREMCTSGTQTD